MKVSFVKLIGRKYSKRGNKIDRLPVNMISNNKCLAVADGSEDVTIRGKTQSLLPRIVRRSEMFLNIKTSVKSEWLGEKDEQKIRTDEKQTLAIAFWFVSRCFFLQRRGKLYKQGIASKKGRYCAI